MAKEVVAPRRSATSAPVGRVRSSPNHGSKRSKTWCMIPVPRVSVRNSVRKPIRAREGTTTSIRTQPLPWLTSASVRPLRSAKSWVIDAEVLLGSVDGDALDGLVEDAVDLAA